MRELFNRFLIPNTAMAGSLALHLGIGGAWVLWPDTTAPVSQQQIIEVVFVAPSSTNAPAVLSDAPTDTPFKMNGVTPLHKKLTKEEKQTTEKKKSQATSGKQAEHAKETNSAITERLDATAYLNNPPPAYPPAARRQNIEGTVLLEVEINDNGKAADVTVARSSGSSLLDSAALNAVTGWRFTANRAKVTVPIVFKITRR